ncbi:MAG: 2-hydroxyglutaryl-CoA dehydratase [Firmicutes bacterium]|nr:2-hydroxyglutaryl-CoA dehydratase [Bacillota bacterium]
MKAFLGIDVGSVSTKLVVINEQDEVLYHLYNRTQGQPVRIIQEGIKHIASELPTDVQIAGAGTTGSARHLAGAMIGADVIKNEITAHAVATSRFVPGVQTILEIGGQDSKIIILRDGVVVDFAMNTVCAAGTGSFLDQQATRLSIPIEDFGQIALKSKNPVRIAGRCAVFAESDMIHKQQLGHSLEDISAGLCEALVRNFLSNLGKGKEIQGPIAFQGGVAANIGIKGAFEKHLKQDVFVPQYHGVMGAIGVAIMAREAIQRTGMPTRFKGLVVSGFDYKARSFDCKGCPNLCEIVQFSQNGKVIARWGDRCGKWEAMAI